MTAAHEPGGEVVQLRPTDLVKPDPGELVEVAPGAGVGLAPAGWLAEWAHRPILAGREEWARQIRWRARASGRLAAWCVTHPHLLVWREVRPIGRGLAMLAEGWRYWQRCGPDQDRIDAMDDKTKAAVLAEKLRPNRARRWWASVAALVLVAGSGFWGWLVYGWPVPALALLALLAVADLLGRRVQPVDGAVSPPPMPILVDDPDVPLSQLQAAVLEVFEREGFAPGAVGVASPMQYEPARLEYRMTLSCLDEIKVGHLRAVERGLGAEEMAARLLGTSVATNRVLVIRRGDPYTDVPTPSWIETGARSITEPLDLGVSVGDTPFTLKFAGLHAVVVGRTGSGKTKGALWAVIDRLSACRDVVLWGVDLMNGPHLARWEGVLQRTAYTPEDAAVLLEAAKALILERGAVLKAHEDADEWRSELGPALVLVLDEFAVLAQHNGEKRTINLLGEVETILRMGRKVWVTIVLGTQKAGNSDLGSTLVESQVSIKMLLACRERDTVSLLGTDGRDAGWAPHTLTPADDESDSVNDAGKLFLESPKHRTPDVYRCWTPLTGREVRERVKRRLADGLPTLDGGTTIDAVEVPDVLVFLERAFRDAKAAELGTATLVGGAYRTPEALSEAAREWGVAPRKLTGGKARGYHLADVETAIGRLS